MFKTILVLAVALASVVSADLPFTIGEPVIFGSGCPEGSVAVIPAGDGQTLSVLFASYAASTTSASNRDYTSCALAVNLDLKPGFTIAVTKVDYRGNAFVAKVPDAKADFSAEYFFTGMQGDISKQNYTSGFNGNIFISDTIETQVWSRCGVSTNLRINTALTAYRPANTVGDVQIAIDSADAIYGGFNFQISSKQCL